MSRDAAQQALPPDAGRRRGDELRQQRERALDALRQRREQRITSLLRSKKRRVSNVGRIFLVIWLAPCLFGWVLLNAVLGYFQEGAPESSQGDLAGVTLCLSVFVILPLTFWIAHRWQSGVLQRIDREIKRQLQALEEAFDREEEALADEHQGHGE